MTADRVPVRHSLITRLLITSMVIAVAAIASTAWLAATTTTRAISHEQGGAAADQRAVYQALLGYAATHHDWPGAATMVHSRAEEIGRRITLTTDDRRVILDSHTGPVPENSLPAAAVDPLDVDLGLTGGVERIDERAVGPYVVPGEDRYVMNEEAGSALSCFRKLGYRGVVDVAPTGRPSILLTSAGSRFGTPVPDHSLESCSTGLDSLVSA
ncbi:sensor histidine kinase, partial [Actinoplanes philippinensis]